MNVPLPLAADRIRCANCEMEWTSVRHKNRMVREVRGGGVWNGHPFMLDPFRRWIRENLPHQGFVYAGDDGLAAAYSSEGDGKTIALEVKTSSHGNVPDVDRPTVEMFRQLWEPDGYRGGFGILLVDGSVPSELAHYPVIDRAHQLPPPAIVAERCFVQYFAEHPADDYRMEVSSDELVGIILDGCRFRARLEAIVR